MYLAAGQFPHQPGVHRAEQDLTARRLFARAFHMVENPLDFGAGKVRIRDQTGGAADVIGQALPHQLIHNAGCAAALPDDRVVNRPAGVAFPQDGGLALVGDADARHVRRGNVCRRKHLEHGGILG